MLLSVVYSLRRQPLPLTLTLSPQGGAREQEGHASLRGAVKRFCFLVYTLLSLIYSLRRPPPLAGVFHDGFADDFVDGGDSVENEFQTGFAEGGHALAASEVAYVVDAGVG